MKRKSFYAFLVFLCFAFLVDHAYALDISGIGDGASSPGSSEYCNATQGCMHGAKGVRVTLVDESGERISGTKTVDYWDSVPSGALQLPGSTYKTKYINNRGNISLGNNTTYSQYTSTALDHIGGLDYKTISGSTTVDWSKQHDKVQAILEKAVSEDGGVCEVELFRDLGYTELCKEQLEMKECSETFMKTYILLEPLFYVNVKGNDFVLTGTEYTYVVHVERQIDSNRVYNLSGPAGYGTALMGMYLTKIDWNDDTDYALHANGSKYVRVKGVSGTNRYTGYKDWVHTAAYGASDEYYPLGTSMQIVWLGELAEEICDDLCVFDPENPDEEFDLSCCDDLDYVEDYYEYYPDTPFMDACCFDPEYVDYYSDNIGFKDESEFLEACCFEPGTKSYSYYAIEFKGKTHIDLDAICKEPKKDGNCPNYDNTPEVELAICDNDNEENISYFRDGVFNSKNGELAYLDIKSYDDVMSDKVIEGGSIKSSFLESIATYEISDNSFKGLASTNDTRYSEVINDYCAIHCQEIFQVELPDNYPLVNAGMYFKWTLEGEENIIARASDAKLCVVDIDLDKVVDIYQDVTYDAEIAARSNLAFNCNGKVGVMASSAAYPTCDAYKADYLTGECFGGGTQWTDAGYTAIAKDDRCCTNWVEYEYCCGSTINGVCSNFCTTKYCDAWDTCYVPNAAPLSTEEAMAIFYSGGSLQPWVSYTCKDEPDPVDDRNHGVTRPLDGIRNTRSDTKLSPEAWCGAVSEDYANYIMKAAGVVGNMLSDIGDCYMKGEAIIDMGLEMDYQTLFDTHTYKTPDSIIRTDEEPTEYEGATCVDADNWNIDDELCDGNGDFYKDTYFYMSSETQKFEPNKKLGCKDSLGSWGFSSQLNVNTQGSIDYDPMVNKMALINAFDVQSQQYSYATEMMFWHTMYASIIGNESYYELDEVINACICKDGQVMDANPDSDVPCSCEETMSYEEFTKTFNNYQKLDDGTLYVEYMNGSGTYPINMKYSVLGSLLEDGIGHFDSLAVIEEPIMCSMEGTTTYCTYSDPNGICRYVVNNKIIAEKNDVCPDGDCEPDPDDCPDGVCDDPDYCTDDDCPDDCFDSQGIPIPDCKNISGLNVIYRVIDLNNPFPGTDGTGRSPGSNWSGKEEFITNNRGVSGSAVYSQTPLYSFELTPAAIKEIREDNQKLREQYGDYLFGTVVYPNGNVVGGGYSLFVHRTLYNDGDGIVNDPDAVSSINIALDDRFTNILDTGSGVR